MAGAASVRGSDRVWRVAVPRSDFTTKARRVFCGDKEVMKASASSGNDAVLGLDGAARAARGGEGISGAIEALRRRSLLEVGEVLGLIGDKAPEVDRLRQGDRRQLPAVEGEIHLDGTPEALPQAAGRPGGGDRGRLPGPRRSATTSPPPSNVLLGRELKQPLGPFTLLDHGAMYDRVAGTVRRAEVGNAAAPTSSSRCRRPSVRPSRSPAPAFPAPSSC